MTDAYDAVYKWMHVAYGLGYRFFGYAIMPNHVHFIIRVPEDGAINNALANGKRFVAYEIVKRLKALCREDVLERLRAGVRESDASRGQRHRVFETSTDLIELFHARMIEQKLKYIHANPVSKAWRLADDAVEYPHSSFAFYSDGRNREAPLGAYQEHGFLGGKGAPWCSRSVAVMHAAGSARLAKAPRAARPMRRRCILIPSAKTLQG